MGSGGVGVAGVSMTPRYGRRGDGCMPGVYGMYTERWRSGTYVPHEDEVAPRTLLPLKWLADRVGKHPTVLSAQPGDSAGYVGHPGLVSQVARFHRLLGSEEGLQDAILL